MININLARFSVGVWTLFVCVFFPLILHLCRLFWWHFYTLNLNDDYVLCIKFWWFDDKVMCLNFHHSFFPLWFHLIICAHFIINHHLRRFNHILEFLQRYFIFYKDGINLCWHLQAYNLSWDVVYIVNAICLTCASLSFAMNRFIF